MEKLRRKAKDVLTAIGERGGYWLQYYLDYSERELDDKRIKEVFGKHEPEDVPSAIHDLFCVWDWNDRFMYEGIVEEVRDELDIEDELSDDEIIELARDVGFFVDFDINEVLDHNDVNVVVRLDHDVGNPYDAGVSVYPPSEWEWNRAGNRIVRMDDETQLAMRRLGTSMTAFIKWYNDGRDEDESPFFYSLWREFFNMYVGPHEVVFLLRMSINEYLELLKAKEIVIHPGTTCGFVDMFINGSGSVLEVKFPKPLKLKGGQWDAMIDGERGLGIDQIYWLVRAAWEGKVEVIK